jgi:serine phosphatase RsbU (regulator of sigma subunit)
MKSFFASFHFAFVIAFIAQLVLQPFNSFSQKVSNDTIVIRAQLDSCHASGDVLCGKALLAQIQIKLAGTSIEKEKVFYRKAEIITLRNIGSAYRNLSNNPQAMEYYEMSRKNAEKIGDKQGLAAALLNVGNIYIDISDFVKAMEYMQKALNIFNQVGDKRGIGICLMNIGNIFKFQSNYTKALEYYKSSLNIQEQRADTLEIMTCLNNIGFMYKDLSNYSKALEYLDKGKNYGERINDLDGVASSLSGMGEISSSTGKLKEAEKQYDQAFLLASKAGDLPLQSEILIGQRGLLEQQGRYKEALIVFDKHLTLRDSINSENKIKEIALKDAKYDSDKKEATMAAVSEEEKQKSKIILLSVLSGFLLVIIFSGFIFRSLRITRKQKSIIEIKGKEIESKNKDITDSITYAKRIQQAKLPEKKEIYASLPDCFVLFKPKDIVSGDFYYFHKKEEFVYIAAADCTGHGVPGAFMSMIGSDKLEGAVSESSDPSEILSLLNTGIKTSLRQSDSDESTRDGMDIALCSIDTVNRIVKYAGANRPIWIIRKGQTLIEEIKATKKAIGGLTEDKQHFDSFEITLKQGDTFYLSTDGYADTFNGRTDKKLTTRKFKEILLAMQDETMQEQEKQLDNFIEEWKAGIEQVDDILVIGVRL